MLSLVDHPNFPFDPSTSKHTLEELRTDLTTKLHAESSTVLLTLIRQMYSLPRPYCSVLSDLAIACRRSQDTKNFLSIIQLKELILKFLESQPSSQSCSSSSSSGSVKPLSNIIEEDFERIFKDDMALVDLPVLRPVSPRPNCSDSSGSDMDLTADHLELEPKGVENQPGMMAEGQALEMSLLLPGETVSLARYRFYSPVGLVPSLEWLRDRFVPWIEQEFEASISIEQLEDLHYDAHVCINANVFLLSLHQIYQRWNSTAENLHNEVQPWYAILALEAAIGLLFPAHLTCLVDFDSSLQVEEQRWAFLKSKQPSNSDPLKPGAGTTQQQHQIREHEQDRSLNETRGTNSSASVGQTSSHIAQSSDAKAIASPNFSFSKRKRLSRRAVRCQGECGADGQGRMLKGELLHHARKVKGRVFCRDCRRSFANSRLNKVNSKKSASPNQMQN